MREIINLNNGWEFTECCDEAFLNGCGSFESVRLPHTCKTTPYNYFDESVYQMVSGYRKKLRLGKAAQGKRVFLVIEAAAHCATVFVDGKQCRREHKCGYTAFEAELTDLLSTERESVVAIKVDSRETRNTPPFGKVVDYMTYGGLYREVRLEIREQGFISDVFVRPTIPPEAALSEKADKKEIEKAVFKGVAESTVATEGTRGDKIVQHLLDESGNILAFAECGKGEKPRLVLNNARMWDVLSPTLYTVKTELFENGEPIDRVSTVIGFRKAVFKPDGFYLNGRKLKITGLNRHQSYPYVGYAMPRSIQRFDADILKNELGLNAVRTSHYPQSHHFIDRCDELGLLVFTEIPGWQHIGDSEWKKIAVKNTEEMVVQYRNHPSIILWGVRINESQDDDEFYRKTNKLARALDPTRQTGGVRCNKNSSLLEDVYTYNDFVHDGTNQGCEPKKAVTSNINKPYLISEYNGHMYPTKSFDDEEQRLEHALRHARVLNSAASYTDIAGSFGWCMFDYNTHKDFGSGDRICYHGVCDMFRNPKLAAAVYACNQSETPVLEISSTMDIGEHPAGNRGRVYAFTNADSVRFFINGVFIREYTAADSEFKKLKHPPIEINDFIGDRIINEESFTPRQARLVKEILNESTRFGMNNLSPTAKLKAATLMTRYRMTFDDAYALYGKYIGNWGQESTSFTFEAVKNGKVVKTVIKQPFSSRRLTAEASSASLVEDSTYDVAAVRIRMTDQNGCTLPFFVGAVNAELEGEAEIIGGKTVILRGGTGGLYIKTTGKSGKAKLTLCADGCESVTADFNIICKEEENER